MSSRSEACYRLGFFPTDDPSAGLAYMGNMSIRLGNPNEQNPLGLVVTG